MKKFIAGAAFSAACLLCACSANTSKVTSAADSADMAVQRNKQTAYASKMAFVRKDVDEVFKNCAPGFKDYGSDAAVGESNIDSVKAGMMGFIKAFPDIKGENLTIYGHADTVIIIGTWSGTFKAPLGPVKPTGKSFKIADTDIYTFNAAGKITSYRSLQSDVGYYTQVAAVVPADVRH
jgi:predicted ester cyclase